MSAYSREILQATRLLCGSRGAMQLLQLHRKLLQRCDITEEEFIHIMEGCSRFLLVRGPAGDAGRRPEDCTVVAQTSLRLCRSYGREEPCGGEGVCEQLHLCRFFVYGTCRFGKGR
ncbi:poly [ADP-ribose] polymerase 12-like [Seriola lalandi dorsalis]|nr:poly [ADP-ribose] polymerase 12-like [Seriola lalandi dorsalis]